MIKNDLFRDVDGGAKTRRHDANQLTEDRKPRRIEILSVKLQHVC